MCTERFSEEYLISGHYLVEWADAKQLRASDAFELRQFFQEHPELWGKATVRYVAYYTVPESVMHAVNPHRG